MATHSVATSTQQGRGRRTVRIRVATESDVDGILACLRTAFQPYRRRYSDTAYTATVLTRGSALRRLKRMTVLVAVGGRDSVVGTVAWKRVSKSHAHVRGMAVLPAWQGKGVGARLLRDLVGRVGRSGARRVTLETTDPLGRARRFYRSHGFRPTGRTRRWGGMRLTAFELRTSDKPKPARGTRVRKSAPRGRRGDRRPSRER